MTAAQFEPRDQVSAQAAGKINVALHVGAPREDGYHELQTLFLAVSCYEQITVMPRRDGRLTVEFTNDSADFINVAALPTDEKNLAIKAAQLLQEAYHVRAGAHLRITKNVPVAGGMGGGSADAAAALLACAALWGLPVTKAELVTFGAELGADVPFAVTGGAALGSDIGNHITPILTQNTSHWVIVPAIEGGLSTPRVYHEFDRIKGYTEAAEEQAPDPISADMLRAFTQGSSLDLTPYLRNDLQPAALALFPGLNHVLELGLQEGALATMISGSGPTIMMLCQDAHAAASLAARLKDQYNLPAWPVWGPTSGATII